MVWEEARATMSLSSYLPCYAIADVEPAGHSMPLAFIWCDPPTDVPTPASTTSAEVNGVFTVECAALIAEN